jgi:serine/threonine protein phosphatase 1
MFTRIPGVPLFRRLAANTRGRDFIVADVHGCYTLLQRLLDKVSFDPTKDRLIIAGDLIDRGPESIKALDWIYKPWVHVVAGNHDLMLLVAAYKGGDEFHEEHGGEWFVPVMREQPDLAMEFVQVFEGLPIALEVECLDGRRFGIVHAECPHFDWNDFTHALEHEQNPARLDNIVCAATQMRTRDELKDTTCVTGIDTVFVGHSLMDQTQLLGNTLYIDTWASSDKGRLTLMQMDTRQEWTLSRPELRAMRLREQESANSFGP